MQSEQYDFWIQNDPSRCCCGCEKYDYDYHEQHSDTSSSENEEDFFTYVVPIISEDELSQLVQEKEPPLKSLRPLKRFLEPGMTEQVLYLCDPENFFIVPEKKILFFKTLPNSYQSLQKRDTNEPVWAPSYLTEEEAIEYTKPMELLTTQYTEGKGGMALRYRVKGKLDEQSNYIRTQRIFYSTLLKERLANKTTQAGEVVRYELPCDVYEPVSLIKRFCDMWTYLIHGLEMMYEKKDDEEYCIKKLTVAILSGAHKALASQGVPLPPLIGETYEVTSENGEMKLFAEVKNNDPIKIVYNMRWRERIIVIDGFASLSYQFKETEDHFVVKISGFNKLKMKFKDGYKLYYFNLPTSATFQGIVDTINGKNERHVSLDGIMYVRAPENSCVIALNYFSNPTLYDGFHSMFKKTIINVDLNKNGHSFIGLTFHNAGFSPEIAPDDPRIVSFILGKNSEEIIVQGLNQKTQIEKKTAFQRTETVKRVETLKRLGSIKKAETLKSKGDQEANFDMNNEKEDDNLSPNVDAKKDNTNQFKKNDSSNLIGENSILEQTKKVKNKDPSALDMKCFISATKYLINMANMNKLIACFTEDFIDKIFLGSWANMNFFQIEYSTKTDIMTSFYLKLELSAMKQRPSSDFNLKTKLKLMLDPFHFYNNLKSVYGNLWKNVKKPMITDTRYREDFLWLLRLYQLLTGLRTEYTDPDALQAAIEEAAINFSIYKPNLETYVHVNITEYLNKTEKESMKKVNAEKNANAKINLLPFLVK